MIVTKSGKVSFQIKPSNTLKQGFLKKYRFFREFTENSDKVTPVKIQERKRFLREMSLQSKEMRDKNGAFLKEATEGLIGTKRQASPHNERNQMQNLSSLSSSDESV